MPFGLGSAFGKLNVVISANTDQLKKGFTEANKSVNKFANEAKRTGGTIKGLIKGFTILAGAIGAVSLALSKLTKDFIAYGVSIDKMVKTTGLAAETLSGLKFAADQEHTSIEVLNKGILNLAKTMDFAGRGTNDYSRAFESLGIRITEADGTLRSVEEVFFELADAIKNSTNWTKTMADAQNLLGRAGKDAVAFFKLGSETIKDYIKEAKRLGITVTDLEAKQLKALDDEMTTIRASFRGMGFNIARVAIPALKSIIPVIKDQVIPVISTLITKIGDFFKMFATERGKLLRSAIHAAELDMGKLSVEITKFLETGEGDWDALVNRFEIARNNVGVFKDMLENLNTTYETTIDYTEDLTDDIDDTITSLSGEIVKLDFATDAWAKYWDEKTGWRKRKEISLAAGVTKDIEDEIIVLHDAHVKAWMENQEEIAAANEAFVGDMQASFSFFFQDILTQTKKSSDIIKDFFKSIRDAFFKMLADMAAKRLFASIFGAAIGGGSAGGFGLFQGLGMLFQGIRGKKYGGFATGESLPKLKEPVHAQRGLVTKGVGPIPAILHPDEAVLPRNFIGDFFKMASERLFSGLQIPQMPTPAMAAPTINIYVPQNSVIDDPAFWRNLYRTKIQPAMTNTASGRVR
jgi:hypothetical protein